MTIVDQVEAFRTEDFYENYLRAREAIIAMKTVPLDRIPEFARPTDDWSEKVSIFAYLFDASPSIIAQLRRHCHRLIGIETERYRYDKEAEERPLFENKLQALRSLDMGNLFIPEPLALGGFGYDLSAGLANLETLKLYECLVAMELGGALAALRRLPERQIVLDIGPGWGGLTHALKTLFPKTCFVLCDLPEMLLFSATFLPTVFPQAKIAFVTSEDSGDNNWAEYDFIFVPHTLHQEIKPERLDLVVDSGSSRLVSNAMLRAHVRLAASLGCPLVYKLCSQEPDDVTDIIEESYWVSEIPMLLVPYTELLETPDTDARAVAARWRKTRGTTAGKALLVRNGSKEGGDYKHLVGWKRLG